MSKKCRQTRLQKPRPRKIPPSKLTSRLLLKTTAKVGGCYGRVSTSSNKLDIFAAKSESDLQRIEEDLIEDLERNKLAVLTNHMDDQEARSRRDNTRIFSVREGIEESNALLFFETWLPKLLHMDTKKGKIRLGRCHRGLGQPKPRMLHVVVLKLH